VNPKIAAIVVNYDAGNLLEGAVRSLLASDYPNLEIHVVDNASPARNRDVLDRVAADVPVIHNSSNLGFGRACNDAARQTDGTYLVFLNPDVVVSRHWLTPLVDAFEANPQLAIVSPTTLYPNEPPPAKTGVIDTASVPGCALMIRRTAWNDLGGFDDTFFLYWEDTDLCWRAWNAGWRVVESFDSLVYHSRGGSSGAHNWVGEQIRNGTRTYLKNMRWRVVMPFLAKASVRTLLHIARTRDMVVLKAWAWNVRELKSTLRERQRLRERRTIAAGRLEALVREHRARQTRERHERVRRVAMEHLAVESCVEEVEGA
jgi:GT2 family glycosyltransferase